MTKPLFEHITCPRCGGSGTYSFNLMHGSRCYGCGGTGNKLTKRGAAAQKYLDDMRKTPVSELKVGDLIWFEGWGFKCCSPVTSIEPDPLNTGLTLISGIRAKTGESIGFGTYPTVMVERGFSTEQKQAMREKALAYQATLTKAGVPSKRAAA